MHIRVSHGVLAAETDEDARGHEQAQFERGGGLTLNEPSEGYGDEGICR